MVKRIYDEMGGRYDDEMGPKSPAPKQDATETPQQATHAAALLAALRECMGCMDSLRDFVAEGGSRHMVGAVEAIHAADRALDVAHAIVTKATTE